MTTPATRPIQKRRKGLDTTRQILDAAADLFAQNGFDGVTVRAIAQKAGIQESSLYNHFQSKAAILETLYREFTLYVPQTRPDDAEIDRMLTLMEPEEVFKSILFHVGKAVGGTLSNTVMVINFEKFRNQRAADMYYQYVVREPAAYYERLIEKMMERKMVKPVNARLIAEQYNYISIALTKEYIMAQHGFADVRGVVAYMVETLRFFCRLMKPDDGEQHEKQAATLKPEPALPPV